MFDTITISPVELFKVQKKNQASEFYRYLEAVIAKRKSEMAGQRDFNFKHQQMDEILNSEEWRRFLKTKALEIEVFEIVLSKLAGAGGLDANTIRWQRYRFDLYHATPQHS